MRPLIAFLPQLWGARVPLYHAPFSASVLHLAGAAVAALSVKTSDAILFVAPLQAFIILSAILVFIRDHQDSGRRESSYPRVEKGELFGNDESKNSFVGILTQRVPTMLHLLLTVALTIPLSVIPWLFGDSRMVAVALLLLCFGLMGIFSLIVWLQDLKQRKAVWP